MAYDKALVDMKEAIKDKTTLSEPRVKGLWNAKSEEKERILDSIPLGRLGKL